MKRLGNIYSNMLKKDIILQAIYEGTAHKHHDPVVKKTLLFSDKDCENHPELIGRIDPKKADAFADTMIHDLKNGIYHHSPPLHKFRYCTSNSKKKGKWRHLYVPTLYDHILHHVLMIVSMDAFTRGMDPYCCGSVPGRGQKTIYTSVPRWLQNKNLRFFVKLDIYQFFNSIDRESLFRCLLKYIKDKQVLVYWLHVLYSAPVAAPIGYYSSPWLANLYLQDVDHFIRQDLYKIRRDKRIPYVKKYARYADDMLLIGSSKRDLEKAVHAIKQKLEEKGLKIKDNWEIKRIAEYDADGHLIKGTYRIDMCGYVFDRTRTVLRSGIYLSTMREARSISRIQKTGRKPSLHSCQSFSSKLGWSKHGDCFGMRSDINDMCNIAQVKEVISDASRRTLFQSPGTIGI